MRVAVGIILIVAHLAPNYDCAKILGIFHVPTFSHQILGITLMQELANRGHDVTMIITNMPNVPVERMKIIEIVFNRTEEEHPNMFEYSSKTIIEKILEIEWLGLYFAEQILNHTLVQDLLKSHESFDLVITEQFMNEAFRGFCHHYRTPCVMLSTLPTSLWSNLPMGNPGPPSYVPDMYLNFSDRMNFWERLYNTVVYTGRTLYQHFYLMPKQNELLRKYFPNAPPNLEDLYYNSSLMLVNAHVSTSAPVPLGPNVVDIGGFHLSAPKKLTQELQDFLDGAKDGAILFSMGSYLRSRHLPKETREGILRVFASLKQKVLWKWEEDSLPDKPSNVKIGKWLPQNDILAHPNIQLFITHGGILSAFEAIHHGVPLLAIPVYGDQEKNVANAVVAGYAVGLRYTQLNEESFNERLHLILNNSKYRENARKRSRIIRDQPMKPLDKAVFWVEYVMRHEGAPHLKSAALNLMWYQYLLLDVLVVLIVVLAILLTGLFKLMKILFGRKHSQIVNTNKKKKKKKNV